MSQKKKSLKVPADLMQPIKEFHLIRRKVQAEMETLNNEYMVMQRRMKREQERLNNLFGNATEIVREALLAAKLVGPEEVFVIDTTYLDEHGEAFINIDPTEDGGPSEPPQRTLH
jgi:hypothetical protein